MEHTQHTPPADHAAAGAHLPPDLAHAVEIGYEPHDIALRGVFIFIISLVIVSVIVLGAMWVVMKGFLKFDRTFDPINSPVVVGRIEPPQPLQPSRHHEQTDYEDMKIMQEQTFAQLHSAGVSPTGRHFISIDQAMDQVLPQLPVHPARVSSASAAAGGAQ